MIPKFIRFLSMSGILGGAIMFYGLFLLAFFSPGYRYTATLNVNAFGEAWPELMLMTMSMLVGVPMTIKYIAEIIEKGDK